MRGQNALQKKDIIFPFLLIAAIFIIYQINDRVINSVDTLPAEYLPLSFIKELNFNLNEFDFLYEKGIPYSIKKIGENFYSAYPVGAALWATPFFLAADFLGQLKQENILILSKISASFAVVLSALFIFYSVRLLSNSKTAYAVTIIYSLATSSWSASSQALWQHGPGQLFSSIGIYFLVRGESESKLLPISGLFFAMGIWCRPTLAIGSLIAGIYIFHKYRRFFLQYLFFSSLPVLLLVYYNHSIFGSILGGYNTYFMSLNLGWLKNLLSNLFGLLISPSRGLLTFSPILFLAFIGIYFNLINFKNVLFHYFSAIIFIFVLLNAGWISWWGGWSFGPRLLTDTLPYLCIMLVPAIRQISWTKMKLIFVSLLMLWSVFIQVIGSFIYNGGWNKDPNIDFFSERLWFWKDSQISYYLNRILPVSYIGKGINHEINGDTNAALKAYENDLKINPENSYSLFKTGKFYYQANKMEKARTTFQKLISVYPNYIPARLYSAYIYENNRDYTNAIREYKTAMERKGNDTSGILKIIGYPPFGDRGLGYLYVKKGEYGKLSDLFNKTILATYYKAFDFSEINFQFEIPYHLYYGWVKKEDRGVWSNNLESVLLLHFDKSKAPFNLSVKVRPIQKRDGPQIMKIYLDNDLLSQYKFTDDNIQTIKFIIPEKYISKKYQFLRFVFANRESSDDPVYNKDGLKFNAAFYEIKSHSVNALRD